RNSPQRRRRRGREKGANFLLDFVRDCSRTSSWEKTRNRVHSTNTRITWWWQRIPNSRVVLFHPRSPVVRCHECLQTAPDRLQPRHPIPCQWDRSLQPLFRGDSSSDSIISAPHREMHRLKTSVLLD